MLLCFLDEKRTPCVMPDPVATYKYNTTVPARNVPGWFLRAMLLSVMMEVFFSQSINLSVHQYLYCHVSVRNRHVVQPLQKNAVAPTNSSATTGNARLSTTAVTVTTTVMMLPTKRTAVSWWRLCQRWWWW